MKLVSTRTQVVFTVFQHLYEIFFKKIDQCMHSRKFETDFSQKFLFWHTLTSRNSILRELYVCERVYCSSNRKREEWEV